MIPEVDVDHYTFDALEQWGTWNYAVPGAARFRQLYPVGETKMAWLRESPSRRMRLEDTRLLRVVIRDELDDYKRTSVFHVTEIMPVRLWLR
jgi:hypothetical protein